MGEQSQPQQRAQPWCWPQDLGPRVLNCVFSFQPWLRGSCRPFSCLSGTRRRSGHRSLRGHCVLFSHPKSEGQRRVADRRGSSSSSISDTRTDAANRRGGRTLTLFWAADLALQPTQVDGTAAHTAGGGQPPVQQRGLPLKKTWQPADAISELPVSELARLSLSHYPEVQS